MISSTHSSNASPANATPGQQPSKHIEEDRNDPLVQEGARVGRNRAPLVGPDSVTGTRESASESNGHQGPEDLGQDQLEILKKINDGQRVVGDDATWAVKQGYAQQAEDSDIGLTDQGRAVLDGAS